MRKVVIVFIAAMLFSGCAVQRLVLNKTTKVFDTVEYNYKREGNKITRSLHAEGEQEIELEAPSVIDLVAP